ncbi:hypothetical protein JOD54_000499 [Actinokineospora baliensis]|uniref:hypothetical protein n=1 Tax=Actinokineospora baliensis TaxID=547056 RepID=UPI001956B1F3|nr:hypothetical protein [Actinokineospora baliensis]MBM7770295.1 hypothetical protein [Actinokineospora baliensis]
MAEHDHGPVLPAAVLATAAVAAVVPVFVAGANTTRVVLGALFALVAVVVLLGRRSSGPGRFATAVLGLAVAAGLTYFQAISGAGLVGALCGALFLVAVLVSAVLPGARSKSTVNGPVVR